ncbi:3877_t:CDS:1, partial [Cetraspora pellucida]
KIFYIKKKLMRQRIIQQPITRYEDTEKVIYHQIPITKHEETEKNIYHQILVIKHEDIEKVAYYQIPEIAKVKAIFERDKLIKKE